MITTALNRLSLSMVMLRSCQLGTASFLLKTSAISGTLHFTVSQPVLSCAFRISIAHIWPLDVCMYLFIFTSLTQYKEKYVLKSTQVH